MSEAPAKEQNDPGEAIAIAHIILHERYQARDGLNEEAVRPIETFDVEGVGLVVVDGWHRVNAMLATGAGFIRHISAGEEFCRGIVRELVESFTPATQAAEAAE